MTAQFPGASGGAAGVSSFNTRTGAVSLSKADVTGTGLAAADVGADASGAAAAEATLRANADALLAPKASPALTGTPTVPTASALTSSTQAASTAYADAAVSVEASTRATADALALPLANVRTVRFNAGAFSASQSRDVAVTWGSAFADANYTVTATLVDTANTANNSALRTIQGTQTAGGFTVRIASGTVGYTSGQLMIHAIAIHD